MPLGQFPPNVAVGLLASFLVSCGAVCSWLVGCLGTLCIHLFANPLCLRTDERPEHNANYIKNCKARDSSDILIEGYSNKLNLTMAFDLAK